MIEPTSIHNFIKTIQSNSVQPQSSSVSNRGYLGRDTSLIQNHFGKEASIHKQFENITKTLTEVREKDSLADNDIVLLNQLKEALSHNSLPDSLRFDKEKLLRVINDLQQFKETYLPSEILTHINSYNTHLQGETSLSFLQSRQELFAITAEDCQKSSLLKGYLPEEKDQDAETFVKGIYTNLMNDVSQFSSYGVKQQELRDRYGNSMTVRRLEEMSQWVQSKHDEQFVHIFSKIAKDNQLTGLEDVLKNSETTAVKAQAIRGWLGENQTSLESIDEINLSHQKLEILPKEIGLFIGLTKLYLDDNQLTTIPIEIGQLRQLQMINLRNNQVTTIPKELGRLLQLRMLDFSNNKLTTIPIEIGQLIRLRILELNNNQLTTIPKELGLLLQLQTLDVGNNQLNTIPIEIGQLIRLKILDLNNNQLTTIPKELGLLLQLEMLDVGNNQLNTIPKELGLLLQLRMLNLDNNKLTAIQEEIKNLPALSLKGLKFGNNPLTTEKN